MSSTGLGSYWTLNGSDLYPNQSTYDVAIGTTVTDSKLSIRDMDPFITIRDNIINNSAGDTLGGIQWGDGYQANQAKIVVERGTSGSGGDYPTDIAFYTTPDGSAVSQERFLINYNGDLVISDGTNKSSILGKYASYNSGHNVWLQSGNQMVIGSGEAASALRNTYSKAQGNNENLYLGSDNNIYIYQGLQSAAMPAISIVRTAYTTTTVGIATESPDTGYNLDVAGSAHSSQGWWVSSDLHLKKNLSKLVEVLDKLDQIDSYYYNWRSDEHPELNLDSRRQIGVIAQELEKVFPELVTTTPDGYKSVAYDKLSVVLLTAVKEQQAEIDSISDRLLKLEKIIKP
jgi:hypothetical protein